MQVTFSDDVVFLPAAKPGRVQTRFFLIFHHSSVTENKKKEFPMLSSPIYLIY